MATLKDYCEVRTNFKDADFWIIRKANAERVGEVTKEFNREHIGIKVIRTDVLYPNYLYYALMNLQMQRYWFNRVNGVIDLVHITVADVKNIGLG